MDDKITIDLDQDVLAALAQRAESHGHSIGEEVRTIVRDTVAPVRETADWLARARSIRAMTPPGSIVVESWKLIRASRDWDH
ncbi:FitA-like ribbon-helix-helix domain-containing protein [Devosia sp.]|uniref:FitA-like ribbon-helix-helix domain-containing protein n=1 Tax=Devosia sp. TaxID=1871048 RepID=UPI003BAC4BF3